MVLNPEISNLNDERELKSKKNKGKSLSPNCASYRGFTSIDQEMERDIAMQWFKSRTKNNFFQSVTLLKS